LSNGYHHGTHRRRLQPRLLELLLLPVLVRGDVGGVVLAVLQVGGQPLRAQPRHINHINEFMIITD
jgi:hypothetical protein